MLSIKKKVIFKAYKTYETNCIDYEHGHSCHKVNLSANYMNKIFLYQIGFLCR